MMKLDKKSNAEPSGQKLFFNTVLLLLATMLIHSAVALYYSSWYRAVILAGKKAPALVELANEAVCSKVDTLRRQLAFLARQPVLKDLQQTDDVENKMLRLRAIITRVTSVAEPFVGFAYNELRSNYHNLLYWAEFPREIMLRILFDTGLFGSKDQFDDFFASQKNYISTDEEMIAEVNVARNIIALLNEFIDVLFARARIFTAFYGQFAASEARLPVDEAGARNFLVAALTDFKDFRAIVLKSFDGTIRTKAYNINPDFIASENEDVRAIASNAAFYGGNVLVEKSKELPLWHIAVPIRNQNREPIACLSALVDLSFLSTLSQTVADAPDQSLTFIDSSGQFISGPNSFSESELGNEVVVAAMGAGARGVFRLSDYDKNNVFMAVKPVASDEYVFIPPWIAVLCGTLFSYGAFADRGILIAVFLLAALGGYALFYSIPGFFKIIVKEQE